jgi:quinol monooxygenase YgiN
VFVVTAEWVAKPGNEEAVAAAIAALVAPTRSEVGCVFYQPHRSTEDPSVFFLYEQYRDAAAYKAHGESPHFVEHAVNRGIPLLERRTRRFYETIG